MLKFITIQYDSQMSLPGGSLENKSKYPNTGCLDFLFSEYRQAIYRRLVL